MKRRNSSTIPFGYKLQEDGVHLEEIQEELKALNKVVPLVKNKVLSLRLATPIRVKVSLTFRKSSGCFMVTSSILSGDHCISSLIFFSHLCIRLL